MKKIFIIGRLGNDAVLIDNPNNHCIRFSVAVNDEDNTEWFKCVVRFSNDRITIPKYFSFLKKGQKVFVEGSPYIDVWKRPNEEQETSIAIAVKSVEKC